MKYKNKIYCITFYNTSMFLACATVKTETFKNKIKTQKYCILNTFT